MFNLFDCLTLSEKKNEGERDSEEREERDWKQLFYMLKHFYLQQSAYSPFFLLFLVNQFTIISSKKRKHKLINTITACFSLSKIQMSFISQKQKYLTQSAQKTTTNDKSVALTN